MRFYRRRGTHIPQIVGRLRDAIGRAKDPETAKAIRAVSDAFDAVAVELQQYLATLQASNDGGLPSGGAVKDDGTIATGGVIQPVSAAPSSPGTPSGGWVPVDHRHEALVGPAVDLTRAATAEGASELLARADHEHQMLIQAEGDGVDLGNVSAVNVVGPGLDVEVEPNLTGSLLTGLWGNWPVNETSEDRVCTIGTGPLLTQTGGVVASTAGRFGRAITSAQADTQYLEGSFTPRSFDSGLTIVVWVYLPASPTPYSSPGGLLSLRNSAGNDWIEMARFYNGDGIEFLFRSPANVYTTACIPVLTRGAWHLLVAMWDSTTKTADMQVDNGYIYNTSFNPATSVDITGWTFDRFRVGGNLGGQSTFLGDTDQITIYERKLTAEERERLWLNFRATVSARTRYAPHFLFGGR